MKIIFKASICSLLNGLLCVLWFELNNLSLLNVAWEEQYIVIPIIICIINSFIFFALFNELTIGKFLLLTLYSFVLYLFSFVFFAFVGAYIEGTFKVIDSDNYGAGIILIFSIIAYSIGFISSIVLSIIFRLIKMLIKKATF